MMSEGSGIPKVLQCLFDKLESKQRARSSNVLEGVWKVRRAFEAK